MNEQLQEFVSSRGVAGAGRRRPPASSAASSCWASSRATAAAICPLRSRQAAALYEGAKVNVNHPKGSPLAARDYQDRLGSIRNVAVREADGLFGDLHFNPKHALAEQLAVGCRARAGERRLLAQCRGPHLAPGRPDAWSKRLPRCKASTWWPIRPRPAVCTRVGRRRGLWHIRRSLVSSDDPRTAPLRAARPGRRDPAEACGRTWSTCAKQARSPCKRAEAAGRRGQRRSRCSASSSCPSPAQADGPEQVAGERVLL